MVKRDGVAQEAGNALQEKAMTANIHSTAIVESNAQIGDNVVIGPYCIVGSEVVLGDNITLHDRVSVIGSTRLDEGVEVHANAVLGGTPQIASGTEPGQLIIGAKTVVREGGVIHVGSDKGLTSIGSRCYFMTGTHIGHDCVVGDRCVLANGASVGGHSKIGKDVMFGGHATCHQYTWVGEQAMIGGGAVLVGDLIPYGLASGNRAKLEGINIVGLKRRNFDGAVVRLIDTAVKAIFYGDGTFEQRLSSAKAQYSGSSELDVLFDFIGASRPRPLCKAK